MTTKVTKKVVKMSQERLVELRKLDFLSEDQIQLMIDHDFISGKNRKRGRRMMELSDGRLVQPTLSFVGNGKNTPHTPEMVEFKKEFNELNKKYTTVVEV